MNKPETLVYKADVYIGTHEAYVEANKFLTRLGRYEGDVQSEVFGKVGYVVVTAVVYAESGICREFQIAVAAGLMKSYTVTNPEPDPQWVREKPEQVSWPGTEKEQ